MPATFISATALFATIHGRTDLRFFTKIAVFTSSMLIRMEKYDRVYLFYMNYLE